MLGMYFMVPDGHRLDMADEIPYLSKLELHLAGIKTAIPIDYAGVPADDQYVKIPVE